MPKASTETAAWETLAQYLPARSPDTDYWWQLTGRHLAVLAEAAGYPIDKQYEVLLFHYHWAVSSMFFLSLVTYRKKFASPSDC